MSFPTHSSFTGLLEEPQSNPQRSELVQLPEDIGEGTMEGDIYIIEQNGFVSTDILQGENKLQTFNVGGFNSHLGPRFASTQSSSGLQFGGPNVEGNFGANYDARDAPAFPSHDDQTVLDFSEDKLSVMLVSVKLAQWLSLLTTAKSSSQHGGPSDSAGLDTSHYTQGTAAFPLNGQHVATGGDMLIDLIAKIAFWLCYRQEDVAELPSTLNQVLTHFGLPSSIDRMPMDSGIVLSSTSVMGHGAGPTENAGLGAYGHSTAAEFTVGFSCNNPPSATNSTEISGLKTAADGTAILSADHYHDTRGAGHLPCHDTILTVAG